MISLFMPPRQNVGAMVAELQDTLRGRWWGQGPKVDAFEKAFGEKFGFPRCVMVNSGTAALHIAYALAGVGPGDEVIVPVLTCTATCHPILLLGGHPVFADILPETLTIDPADVKRKITKRTRAVVAVHLGGIMAHMPELWGTCRNANIALVEDAAQALGATGGMGDFICFSFQAIKHLSTGDGGMLVLGAKKDEAEARRLRWFDIDREQKIRKGWQAWDRRGITFDQRVPGYKYQPTDIDASIGLVALDDFHGNYGRRGEVFGRYKAAFRELPWLRLVDGGRANAHWLATIILETGVNRDSFADHMRRWGVETNVAHVRNDLFTVFGRKRLPLKGMASIEKRYVCIPLHDRLTDDEVEQVISAVHRFRAKAAA